MVADCNERGRDVQPRVLHSVKPAPEFLRRVVLHLPGPCSGPQVGNVNSHHKMLVHGGKEHAAVPTLCKRPHLRHLGALQEEEPALIRQLHTYRCLSEQGLFKSWRACGAVAKPATSGVQSTLHIATHSLTGASKHTVTCIQQAFRRRTRVQVPVV